jgi:transcriptional regulator with XRE-family HTH domain
MLNNRIRELRLQRGLSQVKLSRLVEVPESQLCAVERGRLWPWPKLRRGLAEVLNVAEDDLFPDTEK